MENPSQSFYSIEELFTLKPAISDKATLQPQVVPSSVTVAKRYPAIIPDIPPEKPGFWKKNIWYFVIGGTLVIGGLAVYFYRQNQQKKKMTK